MPTHTHVVLAGLTGAAVAVSVVEELLGRFLGRLGPVAIAGPAEDPEHAGGDDGGNNNPNPRIGAADSSCALMQQFGSFLHLTILQSCRSVCRLIYVLGREILASPARAPASKPITGFYIEVVSVIDLLVLESLGTSRRPRLTK